MKLRISESINTNDVKNLYIADVRIKAVREHGRPVVFVDIEGIVNFFEDYLNS